ncbi:adenosylcobinamide-phosphate synthase CbiB [Pontibaca methylaminivorans]|uniref:Cobalamin biosynthesis protein CobD n=1 Tax=Pontibaca methylaminivorans TaxID=515897 RepID=A0A1R3WLP8_9RHOB|nr:adenosylcobinamide-phosphate synthase CbiB [Pontibaca methylaminivorans]SIT78366.1 adenosylcobinamide-phosphate synthase [Pontibaca methylaminivorans]
MSTGLPLFLALILDAMFGEPAWLWSRVPHPAVLLGRLVGALERALNRGAGRRGKGVLAVAALGAGAVLAGLLIAQAGPVVEALAAAILLAQRSLVQHVQDVSAALRRSTAEGRTMVARIVSRDCSAMDDAEVARAAIESAAENLSDGIVAPAFWFLIGGLPGMLLYKAVNTADSMIGYRNERFERFGWAAARLDDLLNLIPARLTGFMLAALSGQLRHWRAIAADAGVQRSPNAGWPEAAMARALGVALAGPRSYDGQKRDLPWVNGGGRREIGAADIDRAVALLWRPWGLLLVFALVVGLTDWF